MIAILGPEVSWYLAVAAFLFATGALGVLLRRSRTPSEPVAKRNAATLRYQAAPGPITAAAPRLLPGVNGRRG